MLGHPSCCAHPRRHVEVVTAGVHYGNRRACEILGHDRARERRAGFFGDGQSIQFRAKHDRRSGAVSQKAHDSSSPHAGRDLVAERLQPRSELRRSLHFLEGELGVAMDVLIERLEIRIVRVDLRGRLCIHGRREGCGNYKTEELEFTHSFHTYRCGDCAQIINCAPTQPHSSGALMTLVRRAVLVSAVLAYAAFQRTSASTQTPSVNTDSPAYVAGELVTVTGRDFVPGEILTVQVTHADGTAEPGMGHEPATMVVGSDGSFQFTWTANAADI